MRNSTTLAGLLLFALCLAAAAQSPVQFGFGSPDLAPVKFGGKKLPSWLTSEYAPIFNGVNQYAVTANTDVLNYAQGGSWTIMGWAKAYMPLLSGTNNAIFSKGQNTAERIQITYRGGTTYRGVYLSLSSGTTIINVLPDSDYSAVLGDKAYHHIAVTLTSGVARIFVDGAQIASSSAVGSAYLSQNLPLFFAVHSNSTAPNTSDISNSSLAELSIWNRALSQDEILRYKDKRLKGTESGLVAYYPLNEAPGSTVFVDKVGGKNAVGSNSIQITRRNGYAAPDVRSERYCYVADGSDNVASATNSDVSTYPFTIEGWAFVPALSASQHLYVGSIASGASLANNFYIDFFNNAGTYQLRGVRNNTAFSYNIPSFSPGTWYHAAMVNETATLARLYLNGVHVATDTASKPFNGNYNRLEMGSALGAFGKGNICDVRFWNTARTESEIRANMYQMQTGSETGLAHYYKFIEGTGASVADLGSGAKNATLIAGSDWKGRDIP